MPQRVTTVFACQSCGSASPKWLGRCPECGEWNSYVEEVRGPVDHGFVRSIYFRDPNGYVIELTASTGKHGEMMDPAISKPYDALERWQTTKS